MLESGHHILISNLALVTQKELLLCFARVAYSLHYWTIQVLLSLQHFQAKIL